MSRFIFFDVETKPKNEKGDQEMVLLSAVSWVTENKNNSERIERFDCKSSIRFYNWILTKLTIHHKTWILSANIWFDFRTSGLYKKMKADNWLCQSAFVKGHTVIIKLTKGKYRIDLINVQNYFNQPVEVIGRSINLPKLKVDLETVSKKDLVVYCRRDTEIIYQAFRKLYLFLQDNKLGKIGYTLPSISFGCYTHSFMAKKLHVHSAHDVLALERASYFGGRCECFEIGRLNSVNYYKVDINSMYPFVMQGNYYPTAFVKAGCNIKVGEVKRIAGKYCFIARCVINTDLPYFPYRHHSKTIFPIGCFETVLTTPSLLYGIKNGYVRKIKHIACYNKAVIFNGFVNWFYDRRMEFKNHNNPAFSYVCKLILNSLYGKFGQKQARLVYTGVNKKAPDIRRLIIDYVTHETSIHQVFFGKETITAQAEDEGLNSMPAIASHVTDYARCYLWKLIETAGIGNCYYCDTDSLIINEEGYRYLAPYMDNTKLGLLKLEKKSSCVDLRGAKNYTFAGIRKIKGIPRKAKQNKDGSFSYPFFPSMIGELRAGIKDDYRIETQTKHLTGKYDKGIVLKSGRVKPFSFSL